MKKRKVFEIIRFLTGLITGAFMIALYIDIKEDSRVQPLKQVQNESLTHGQLTTGIIVMVLIVVFFYFLNLKELEKSESEND